MTSTEGPPLAVALHCAEGLQFDALRAGLKRQGIDVLPLSRGVEALPGVVAVVVTCFSADGMVPALEVLRSMNARTPRLPVLWLGLEGPEPLTAASASLPSSASCSTAAKVLRHLAAGRAVPKELRDEKEAPPSPQPSNAAHPRLTARERHVLALVAHGHGNMTISNLLSISDRTVKAHVSSLYRKLRVENRVQLAIAGRELGLVPPGAHEGLAGAP